MIEIILEDGTSLDLKKDWEFEITLEQPMLDDSHIPIPYSTSIALPYTETNRLALKWLDALMLPPGVRKTGCTIHAGGVPLFTGLLEYESMEDGYASYTFGGRDIEDDFSGYIHELKHLTLTTGAPEYWIKLSRDDSGAQDFASPVMIVQQNIGKMEHENDVGIEMIAAGEKYRNWCFSAETPFCPAVYVHSILSEHFKNIAVDDSLSGLYGALAIPGLFIDDTARAPYYLRRTEADGNGMAVLDIAGSLPEITAIDLLTDLCKMLCASVYRDGKGYRLMAHGDILGEKSPADWSGKVSDIYSASVEEGRSYTFGYGNDENENSYDPTEPQEDGSVVYPAESLGSMFLKILSSNDYVAVKHRGTGDIFSGRRMTICVRKEGESRYNAEVPYLDQIFHGIAKKVVNAGLKESHDASVDLKLVRCLPVKLFEPGGDPNKWLYVMAPIMEVPAMDERPGDVYVGCMMLGQLVDHGIAYTPAVYENGVPTAANDGIERKNEAFDLSPEGIWPLHERFAEWLGKDRQVNTVDGNLTLPEIANFRMYRPVSVHNRRFLVKSMRFTFDSSSDYVRSQADLLEL